MRAPDRRPVVEVDEEVRVHAHAALGIAVDLQHPGAKLGIELVVPGRVERVGHVQPPAVQGQLDHLRPAVELAARVVVPSEDAAEPELTGELRVRRIGHVVLAQVAVQPVREIEEAVVHREHQVGDQSGHAAGQRPALELLVLHVDHGLGGEGAVGAVEAEHVAGQRRPHEALLGVGVVQPADLERDQPRLAQVERLLEAPLGKVPEVQPAARSGPRPRPPGSKPPSYALGSPNSDEISTFLRGWYQKS